MATHQSSPDASDALACSAVPGGTCIIDGLLCPGQMVEQFSCGDGTYCCQVGAHAVATSDSGQIDNGGGSVDCVDAGGTCFVGDVLFCTGAVNPTMTCPGPGEPARCCLPTNDCGQPDAATFVCSLYGDGPATTACLSIPLVGQYGQFGALVGFYPDAGIIDGCRITYPVCDNGSPYECTCGLDGGWSCGALSAGASGADLNDAGAGSD